MESGGPISIGQQVGSVRPNVAVQCMPVCCNNYINSPRGCRAQQSNGVMTLTAVRLSDAGSYICTVVLEAGGTQTGRSRLVVDARGNASTPLVIDIFILSTWTAIALCEFDSS